MVILLGLKNNFFQFVDDNYGTDSFQKPEMIHTNEDICYTDKMNK